MSGRRRRSGLRLLALLFLVSTFALCFLAALVCSLLNTNLVASFTDLLLRRRTALAQESEALSLWMAPPIKPRLTVYVFNVTNADEVLSAGETPHVQEVGPFVYEALHSKEVSGWAEGQETLRFRSKTHYTFLEAESVSPASSTRAIVPNLLLMTGMLKREVRNTPEYIKRNMVWPILASAGPQQSFLNLTVDQFLWGYEDERACFEDVEDDFSDEEEQAEKNFSKRKYRRPDGRCLFGAFSDRNGTLGPHTEIYTGVSASGTKGALVTVAGKQGLGVWREGSPCDQVQGWREPSAFAPIVTEKEDTFQLFVGIMCRSISMQRERDLVRDGVLVRRFVADHSSLNFSSGHGCYEQNPDLLPPGVMDMANCCEGAPIGVSMPHFLHADSWYRSQVKGVSAPSEADHGVYVELEPTLGVPVAIGISFQVNLLLSPDPVFAPLANLTRPVTVLPVFWAKEGYSNLPPPQVWLLRLALATPRALVLSLIAACAISAIVFLVATILLCQRRERVTAKTDMTMRRLRYMALYANVPSQEVD